MKKILFTLALLISFSSFGQNNKDALRLCSVLQSNSFSSNSAAEDALERILGTIGASKRFVLQPCSNTNNAVATSYKAIRYILYDPEFLNTLNYGSNWGNLFILAHEVGHHINGHSLDLVLYAADAVESVSLSQSRIQELEADEFAGFVLAKLGGSLSEANKVIQSISSNKDDTYSTHPSRNKRLNAVTKGYNLGIGKKAIVSFPNFGHWQCRKQLVFGGQMPVSKTLPDSWFNNSNIHLCTIKDFEKLAADKHVTIIKRSILNHSHKDSLGIKLAPNLLGEIALYQIKKSTV